MSLPTPAPVLYRGVERLVLAPRQINGAERRTRLALPAAPFAGASGVPVWRGPEAPAAAGTETFALTWLCEGRAALGALDAFFGRRAGRLAAFWLPTYRQDGDVRHVRVPQPNGLTATRLALAGTGYTAAFPGLAARGGLAAGGDDWLAVAPDGTATPLRVTAAVAQPDGTTLWPDTPVLAGPTAAGVAWCRLVLARLAEDTVTTRFLRGDLALVEASAITTVD